MLTKNHLILRNANVIFIADNFAALAAVIKGRHVKATVKIQLLYTRHTHQNHSQYN